MLLLIVIGSLFSLWPIRLIEGIVNLAQAGNTANINQILILGALYLVFQLIGAFANSLANYLSSYLQNSIGVRIQNELYTKLLNVPLINLQSKNSLEITNTLIEDSDYVSNNLVTPVSRLLAAIVSFMIALAFMINIDYRLTLIILPCGLIMSISARLIQNKSAANIKEKRDKSTYLWKIFAEGIKGIMPIRLYHYDLKYRDLVQAASLEMKRVSLAQHKLENLNLFVVTTLFMTTIGIILIASSIFVVNELITVGSLTAVLMYNHMLVDPLIEILNVQQNLIRLKVSLKRINMLFELPNDENVNKEQVKIDQITLEELCYTYEDEKVLDRINFTIKAPAHICIMGESGAGKTTLANLIAGLYTPSAGKLDYYFRGKKVNGVPRISYLIQDGYLFDKSIVENIKIANFLITDHEVEEIIDICCLREVFQVHGDSPIGEDGCHLSGGERKRVRIAQMLANKAADIYIFDELTSSLDEATANKILANIFALKLAKICIFIEHNLNVTSLVDHVFTVSNGKIKT